MKTRGELLFKKKTTYMYTRPHFSSTGLE